ncbi:polysaccharide deacetylase family protein [Spirulina sp. CS-785/01]|uniref:polysaccharide deacetylase family protein n=1 Tax=Spirulina sp. CS-785/01 TaxID=3021716 RepID=UPI0023302300|nr:polysaccharide deacetylase family protein [Spirulina sp. CS-785/01]MDB9315831.1 polysaccharide deacetylase family protein [Spirulina sp. CS-785/01]
MSKLTKFLSMKGVRQQKQDSQTGLVQWQHSLLTSKLRKITLMAAALSLLAGFSLPTSRAANLNLMKNGWRPETKSNLTLGLEGLSSLASNALTQQTAELEAIARHSNFTVPPEFQGKTIHKVPLKSGRKVIALTFDDGPIPKFTNEVLYILQHYNVKATFFLLGQNVQKYPERVRQLHLKGHALANHSWSHPYHKQSEAGAAHQIDNTSAWIQKASGVRSVLFRPPGGYLENGLASYAAKKGQVVVMWSADSKDYYASSQTIVKNVLSQASPGGIVLLHDGGGDRQKTIHALPTIIKELKKQGYEFVTVPELLELSQNEMRG